jgi:3-oxoacyl-[acyl-carrier-protein] synthase-1/3-oxoacyl-[acyl-carrier-protein] synthase II
MTATDSSGVFYAKAMQGALFDAGLEASDIQHINAHGTSTPLNDAAESRALEQVFYQQSFIPPTITSTKSALGHSLGATSAVEAVLSVESLRQQKVLPTLNYHRPGVNEPHLSIVTQGQPQALTRVLSNSFGFGGENASLIFSRGES